MERPCAGPTSTPPKMHSKLKFWRRQDPEALYLLTGLSKLPQEVRILVVNFACSDKTTCKAFSLACTWTREIADQQLYRVVTVRSGKHLRTLHTAPGLRYTKALDFHIDTFSSKEFKLLAKYSARIADVLVQARSLDSISTNVCSLETLLEVDASGAGMFPTRMTLWPVVRGRDRWGFETQAIIWRLAFRSSKTFASVTRLELQQGVPLIFGLIYQIFPNVTHMAWHVDGTDMTRPHFLDLMGAPELPAKLQLFILHVRCDQDSNFVMKNRVQQAILELNWPEDRWILAVDNLDWSPFGEGAH